jgi:hypothetical protein
MTMCNKWIHEYIKPTSDKMIDVYIEPITILSCVSKLFMAILTERLNKF